MIAIIPSIGKAKRRDALGRPAQPRTPDGIDGIRDVDSRCDVFRNGEPSKDGDCMGDGHFLCAECVHWAFETCAWCGERMNRDYLSDHIPGCERKNGPVPI